MNTSITIVPGQCSLEQFESIYRGNRNFTLDPDCRAQIERSADIVATAANGDNAVYGVNTGFGKLASTRIPAEQTSLLQRNLILSHCCGVGEPLSADMVRLILALKLNSLGRGASGVQWQTIQQIQTLARFNIIPWIPRQGSVGASGDLAPLAHLAAVLIGEGFVVQEGQVVPTNDVFKQHEIKPIVLGPKEGLALINGTQVSTAIALGALFDSWSLAGNALITGALASDALMASTAPFRDEIQQLRGHAGQTEAARTLRALMTGSAIREAHRSDDQRVQDPYCLRCQPQVMGACLTLIRQAADVLGVEANAVTDNPLIINDSGAILSGGNFHAEPVAFAADQCALAIAEIGSITERRIATLVDPALNYGLPPFLSPNAGLNSGFMVAEISAAALMSENKQKAAPSSIDSTPTSANQEDHVSMACHGAWRLHDMNQNLASIIGVELLTACQGIEFRKPLATSKPLQDIINRVRTSIPALQDDRFLAPELQQARDMVINRNLVGEVREMLPALYPTLNSAHSANPAR